MKIDLKLKTNNVKLSIKEDNYEKDLFDTLNLFVEFLEKNEDKFQSVTSLNQNDKNIEGNLQINENNNFSKRNESQLKENLESKLDIPEITDSKQVFSKNESSNSNSSPIEKIARDLHVDANSLYYVFDFRSDREIPTIIHNLKGETRVESQRKGVLILMYCNKVLFNQDSLTSQHLGKMLTDSSIDPTQLKNIRDDGLFSKYININKKTYKINPIGIIKAKELIIEIIRHYQEKK